MEQSAEGRQQDKPKAGCGGPRAELIQGKFFFWMSCTLLIVSILISAVTLGTVANLKNSEMTNGSLAGLEHEVFRLREIENSEMTNGSLARLQREIFRLRQSIDPVQLLNIWRPFEESEYYFSSSRGTWEEAEQLCESMNSTLVVINSQEEQKYIRLNVKCEHWIGLHDRAKEGKWRWVDGTDYESNVKFWDRGQPNGRKDFDEDCAVTSGNGMWHDWPCSSIHFAICEKRAD
ncbi:hepatic lectin-like [Mobula birostris]|uniref:hepatic lectin-like n=1 Tax=Mobula birostris TaxID=1983395 RepID=UPI003B287AA0